MSANKDIVTHHTPSGIRIIKIHILLGFLINWHCIPELPDYMSNFPNLLQKVKPILLTSAFFGVTYCYNYCKSPLSATNAKNQGHYDELSRTPKPGCEQRRRVDEYNKRKGKGEGEN